MKTLRIEEFKLNKKQHTHVRDLLQTCFASYPTGRSYFNQLPAFRFLVYDEKILVAHMAVMHRVIKFGDEVATIFGVADLCVHPDYRDKDIASELLQKLESLGKKHDIELILLIATENSFYKKNGFKIYNNKLRWLMTNQHQSFGIVQRSLEDSFMIKKIGIKKLASGTVDLLGSLF